MDHLPIIIQIGVRSVAVNVRSGNVTLESFCFVNIVVILHEMGKTICCLQSIVGKKKRLNLKARWKSYCCWKSIKPEWNHQRSYWRTYRVDSLQLDDGDSMTTAQYGLIWGGGVDGEIRLLTRTYDLLTRIITWDAGRGCISIVDGQYDLWVFLIWSTRK